jgi:hypothetical protein
LVTVVATVSMAVAALPTVCLASAMGEALWQKVDLSAYTTLGILQMKLSTAQDDAGLHLDVMKLEVDGKPLRIPGGVDLKVRDPHLNEVMVVTTRSISCIEEADCLDPAGLPIYVDLLFGDFVSKQDGESECGYSLLRFNIDVDGFSDITRWDCIDGRQVEHVLYERKVAGKR